MFPFSTFNKKNKGEKGKSPNPLYLLKLFNKMQHGCCLLNSFSTFFQFIWSEPGLQCFNKGRAFTTTINQHCKAEQCCKNKNRQYNITNHFQPCRRAVIISNHLFFISLFIFFYQNTWLRSRNQFTSILSIFIFVRKNIFYSYPITKFSFVICFLVNVVF